MGVATPLCGGGHSGFEVHEKRVGQIGMSFERAHGAAGVLVPGIELYRGSARAGTQDKDHALQLVRRLDWRFLMPNPILGDVAYIGPMSGTLPSALQQFSELFTIVMASHGPHAEVKPACLYETVVLRSSAVAAVKNATDC